MFCDDYKIIRTVAVCEMNWSEITKTSPKSRIQYNQIDTLLFSAQERAKSHIIFKPVLPRSKIGFQFVSN